MASTITQFRCLLISPGDVQDEREAISEVFLLWNAHEGRYLQVHVELIRWEISSTPAFGSSPQEILNQQIVDESDFGIAIFWSRLGTPTAQFPSGSAEEITRLAASKKPVMVYFNTARIPQTSVEEFQRLRAFKEEIKSTALCEDFENVALLRERISHHLTTTLAKLKSSSSESNEASSNITSKLPRLVNLVDPFVYQMRRNVYDGLQKFLDDFSPMLQVNMGMIAQLHKLREDSEFLFGPEVVAYIREWIKHAVNVHVGREVIDNPVPSSPHYQGWLQLSHEAYQYFAQQFEPLIDIFRPYLTIPLE